jgi:hypothetical protein
LGVDDDVDDDAGGCGAAPASTKTKNPNGTFWTSHNTASALAISKKPKASLVTHAVAFLEIKVKRRKG